MHRLAIFASGNGSNAENIIKYFENNPSIEVSLVLSNKTTAGVIDRAAKLNVKALTFSSSELKEEGFINSILQEHQIDFIVLAGFLLKIPGELTSAYPNRIVNIHPALLPKYGGKGMYGDKVHEAVIKNHETESGITIHLVNENYDEGRVIFQASCKVEKDETIDSLASKIHKLEHEHFPKVIESLIEAL